MSSFLRSQLQQTLTTALFMLCLAANASAGAPTALRAAIAEHLKMHNTSLVEFDYALFDLNGDGIRDAVVLLKGNYCGSGGCTIEIYQGTKDGFRFLGSSPLVFAPIRVSKKPQAGWRTVIVASRYAGNVRFGFDGKRYRMANVKVSPDELHSAATLTLRH